jgi:hypothetical protein
MKTIIVVSAISAVLIVGCGSKAPQAASKPKAKPEAAVSTASCQTQSLTWVNSSLGKVSAVERDLGSEATAGKDANLGAMQAAATTLATDSQVLLGDLPPACIAGARVNLSTALHDFINASNDINDGSTSDINAGSTEMQAGTDAIQRATTALNQFNGGGSG